MAAACLLLYNLLYLLLLLFLLCLLKFCLEQFVFSDLSVLSIGVFWVYQHNDLLRDAQSGCVGID